MQRLLRLYSSQGYIHMDSPIFSDFSFISSQPLVYFRMTLNYYEEDTFQLRANLSQLVSSSVSFLSGANFANAESNMSIRSSDYSLDIMVRADQFTRFSLILEIELLLDDVLKWNYKMALHQRTKEQKQGFQLQI
ncbi:Hypothetical_protein [Hexamita inflata]|uniref:Hypothetical_protein n=1 Tax=Hexamita inflata TaxID=28002 RepID=A0ABP1HLW2_9EUKA